MPTTTDRKSQPSAEPLQLPVPDFPDDDHGRLEAAAWWAYRLSLGEIADLLQISVDALDKRRRRSNTLYPPLTRDGYRWFCTRRVYHDWWVGLQHQRAADLGRLERDRLVEALQVSLGRPEFKALTAALGSVDRMRKQAEDLAALADSIEQQTLDPYRP